MIPLFDGHCDTLLMLELTNAPCGALLKNGLHVALERCKNYSPQAQFFAVFGEKSFFPGSSVFERLSRRLFAEIEANQDRIAFCTCSDDTENAHENGRLAAFMSVEGAELIDCERGLEKAVEAGVRAVNITWNHANELSGSCVEDSSRGLSDAGHGFVKSCGRLGVIVDVSHLSDAGFWDVINTSERPVMASHSNSRALCTHPRNLTDEQFKAVRDMGGTVGLNLFSDFLGNMSDEITTDTCIRHIEHFLELGGEKTVALGGDLDGCDKLPKGFEGIQSWKILYDALGARGYSTELLGDIFYNNLMRVVKNVCDI